MYGIEPKTLGRYVLKASEFQYVMYMPIKFPCSAINVPDNLLWTKPLIDRSINDFGYCEDYFIYLTSKNFFVEGFSGNRGGWHSDGFLSDDINYIWSNRCPTEFCIQDFYLTACHNRSLIEMEQQAKAENIKTYGENELVRLTQFNIHRVPFCEAGTRSFVKISFSKDKYALNGNAKNPLFNYSWEMKERKKERNDPAK